MTGIKPITTAKPFSGILRSNGSIVGRIVIMLVVINLFLLGCTGEASLAAITTPIPKPLPKIETKLTAAERAAIFEVAWQTVNDKYFDPTFGDKDWQAIGEGYRQKLATVQDDHTFWFELLNPMLFELGVSHIGALPAEFATEIESKSFAAGSLGLDVRLLDGSPVVTRIIEGTPADLAGLRPGFVITTVDGLTLEEINSVSLQTPPDNERHRRGTAADNLRSAFYGEEGEEVVINYLDAKDQPGKATLEFSPRENLLCGQLDPALPPACADFEVERLANGIGYLRFSAFLVPVLEDILQVIDDLKDTPALIIDLRGNPGGQFPVRKAIASQLVGEHNLFMSYQKPDGIENAYLDPVLNPYPGEVVILVDELSTSSSEEFSGSLQALGRATVIGTQTPGSCLVMEIELLPKGAILMYPYAQPRTPIGRVLEGNGVVPDIEVSLDRQQLLQGIDAQLEAAIEYAAEQIRK